nr:MAG TPA: hypothetical protein [Bacteriophage sp.]
MLVPSELTIYSLAKSANLIVKCLPCFSKYYSFGVKDLEIFLIIFIVVII